MALRAGVGKLTLNVVRFLRDLIVRLMTRPAVRGRIGVLSVRMTSNAACGDVCARQWEVGQVVVKTRRLPGSRGVALLTGLRHLQRFVIGVRGRNIVRLVARPTVCRCAGVLAANVTLSA